MLQVRTFALPAQQKLANEFMAANKVVNTNFNKDMIVVFVEDNIRSKATQIADLREYLLSMGDAKFQQEVSLHILEDELKGLNAKHNKERFNDVVSAISNVKKGIANQDLKAAFVTTRINAIETGK